MRKPPARGAPRVLSNSKRAGIEAVQDGYPVSTYGASTGASQRRLKAEDIARALDGIKSGDGWKARCPAHDDANPSLSVSEGVNGKVLFNCKAGCTQEAVIDGLRRANLWCNRGNGSQPRARKPNGADRNALGERIASFDYKARDEKHLYYVDRYEPKDFRRRPAGGVNVLYRWPQIVAAGPDATLFVCEGEKDADRVAALGFIATTVAHGSWKGVDVKDIAGRDVIILEDADQPGVKRALAAAQALRGTAKTIRIVRLPGHEHTAEKHGKDVSDWLDEGHTADALVEACFAVPVYEPSEASVDEAPITPIDLWGHLNPPELSHGLLPAVIEQFAFEQGEVMGVDPGGLAVAALTVCAAAIPDSIELQVKKHDRGWTESARLWTALVGMPSTKKTPTLREAIRPLARIDAAYACEYATAKQVYDDLPSDERKQTTKPERKQLKLEDTSIEAAQEVLRYNSNGMLCLADELSGWFGSMDKYNSVRGAAKDRGFWLQAWNGGSYSVNRVTRSSYLIENLSVSVLGGIQPDLIRKAADESHDDGLIQRLLPIVVRPGTAGRDEPTHETVDAYADLIERLHRLEPTFAAGWDNPSGQATKLEFDYDAQAIRRQLAQKHLELMGLEVINKKLAAHIGKYDAFFARLCVVFHCVEHLSGPTQASMAVAQERPTQPQSGRLPRIITAATAERVAKFLHQFLLRHAAAFYAGILDLSDDHDRLAAVAGHILAHKLDRVTNRDVQRGDRTMRKLTRWDTERVFEQLEALGWVVRKPAPRPADPPHWQVNPEVHRLFADRAGQEATRRAAIRDLLTQLAR
jgi:5S rRNA maturation endonuclease (ribonuclease M5)